MYTLSHEQKHPEGLSSLSMFKNSKNVADPSRPYDLIIIGAGFSGAFTTEEACRVLGTQSKIGLIDRYGLLSPESSSQNECFKLHLGPHYISDPQTAETCLRNSVEMADAFYEFILDKDNNRAPSRRGRHYLMSNSHSVEYIKKECEKLRALYEELLRDFPKAREVFGHPKDFITYLDRKDYPYVASNIPFQNEDGETQSIHVSVAIETPECQIDIHRFKEYFNTVFDRNRKTLDLLYGRTVMRVHHAQDFVGYIIDTVRFDQLTQSFVQESVNTLSVVNCAWQNIDEIDSTINFHHSDNRPSTIRAKLLVKTSVPPSLASMNTCIFSSGPHASLTRVPAERSSSIGNEFGHLLVTFEPETNIGHFPSGKPLYKIEDERLKRLIMREKSPVTADEKTAELTRISQKIMEGAAHYVPDLAEAEIIGYGIGFVKIFAETNSGNRYLYELTSPIHQRREDGIQERNLCYVSFSGVKMTYSFHAAQKVIAVQQAHFMISKSINSIVNTLLSKIDIANNSESSKIRSAIRYSLREYLLTEFQKMTSRFSPEASEDVLQNWVNNINLDEVAHKYSDQLSAHNTWMSIRK